MRNTFLKVHDLRLPPRSSCENAALFWIIMQRVVAFRSWMLADIWYLFELACPINENVIGTLSNREWKEWLSIVFDGMYPSIIHGNLHIIRMKNRVKESNSTWKLAKKTRAVYTEVVKMWFTFWVLVEWQGELRILLGGVWLERHDWRVNIMRRTNKSKKLILPQN